MNNRKLFNDKDELESSMFNYISLQKKKKDSFNLKKQTKENFKNDQLKVNNKNYYFSNVIAKSFKNNVELS